MKFPLLVSALLLGFASPALADEAAPKSAEEPAPAPFEPDLVGGHFQVGASASYAAPFGRLSDAYSRRERGGGGGTFGLDLNYGLDRFVFLGAYGQYSLFSDSAHCDKCSASEWGAGLQVGYHLVQGLRIDPLISYGVGFRKFSSELNDKKDSYDELEWMRLTLGTDWYLSSALALSPFAQFSAASSLTAPTDETAGRVDMRFLFGLRLALDIPGR
jgi:hypothetical protein